jgi:acetyl esterase/lipase
MHRARRSISLAWILCALALPALVACRQGLALQTVNALAWFCDCDRLRDVEYGSLASQRLDLYIPDDPEGSLPVVVFFHGGRWTNGSKDDYPFVGEALSSRGFLTVIPGYRRYPEVKFPSFLEDAALAVRWVHEHAAEYGGDPSKVFLMGHSSGAHMAAMLALDPEYLDAVGGQREWLRGMVGLAGPYDFLPITDADLQDLFGPPDRYPLSQPIRYAADPRVPLLLLQGEADVDVKKKNAVNLSAVVRQNGGHVTERYYPEVDHVGILAALSIPLRGRSPILGDIAAFLSEASGLEGAGD